MFFATNFPASTRFARPAHSLRALHRLLEESQSGAAHNGYRVSQDDKAYTLQFDVPGIAKDQLSIGIEGSVVRLESLPEAPRKYKAAYELPQDIDVSASDAKLENGVLTLKLAKKAPVSNVSTLTIN
jgi:HSP20 family protein